jgi:predicted HTH domain antitoxin
VPCQKAQNRAAGQGAGFDFPAQGTYNVGCIWERITGTSAIQLDQGEDIAVLLQGSNQPIYQVARELIVLELYRRGTISSGKAAQLLDMSRFEFVRYASRLGIAFYDMTDEEWTAEQARAETL